MRPSGSPETRFETAAMAAYDSVTVFRPIEGQARKRLLISGMVEPTLAKPFSRNSSGAAMTLSLPLDEENEYFDQLANRLARELATGFGYSLEEAEKHLSDFYLAYDKQRPGGWTAADYFNHDDSAVVLRIGYELAGGNSSSLEFLEWRKECWEPLRNGERVPTPPN